MKTLAPGAHQRSGADKWLVLPILTSLILAAPHLTQSLWFDETATVSAISRTPAQLAQMLPHVDAAQSAYYFFMQAWTAIFGMSEFALRLPSMLAIAAAVGVAGLLGRRIGGSAVGLLTAFVLALSPVAVSYSVEARPYAITTLLVVCAAWVARTGTPGPARGRTMVLWGVLAALAICFQFLAVFAVMPQVLWLAGRRARWLAALIPAVAFVGMAGFVLSEPSTQTWIPSLTLTTLPLSLVALAGPAGVVILVVGAGVLLWRRTGPSLARVDMVVIVSWALLPIVMLAVASVLWKPIFITRYVIGSMPAFALAAGIVGIAALSALPTTRWRQILGTVTAVLCLLAAAVGLATYPATTDSEDIRAAARYLGANASAGEAIIYSPAEAQIGFLRYQPSTAAGPASSLIIVPGSTPAANDALGPATVTEAEALARLRTVDRVWIVGYQKLADDTANDVGVETANYVKKHWREVTSKDFGRLGVSEWQRR